MLHYFTIFCCRSYIEISAEAITHRLFFATSVSVCRNPLPNPNHCVSKCRVLDFFCCRSHCQISMFTFCLLLPPANLSMLFSILCDRVQLTMCQMSRGISVKYIFQSQLVQPKNLSVSPDQTLVFGLIRTNKHCKKDEKKCLLGLEQNPSYLPANFKYLPISSLPMA